MTEGAFEAMGPDRVGTNDIIDALARKSCWHKNNNSFF